MLLTDFTSLILSTKQQFIVDSGRLELSENKYFYFISSLLPTRNYIKINYQHKSIMNALLNIFILIDRIEKTRELAKLEVISSKSFLEIYWLRVDIGYIHYEMRSIMDYICNLLEKYFDIRVKNNSYNELLKVKDGKRASKLGSDLVNLIQDTDSWFSNLRDTRGKIIHNGKMILPVDTSPEFSFNEFYLKDSIKFLPPDIAQKVKPDDHNIYTVPYLTIYLCLVLNLLDQMGEKLILKLPNRSTSPIRLSIEGLDTFKNWLDRTEVILK